MSVTTAPPTTGRAEHLELRRFLNHLRIQLWWREAMLAASIRAVIGAPVSVAVLVWPSGLSAGASAVVMAAALSVGLAVALVRRPSVVRAARVADRQLRTASRLATAAEVLDGQLGGSLAPAQLADAWRIASGIQPWLAYPYTWRRLQLAIAAFAASLAIVGLAVGGALSPLSCLVLGLSRTRRRSRRRTLLSLPMLPRRASRRRWLPINPPIRLQRLRRSRSCNPRLHSRRRLRRRSRSLRMRSARRPLPEMWATRCGPATTTTPLRS